MAVMLIMLLMTGTAAQVEHGTDRVAEFHRLNEEYQAAVEKHATEVPEKITPQISRQLQPAWPGWEYLPKFLALANENPEDEAALECCQWIIDRCGNIGNSNKAIFDADQAAWEMIGKHQARSSELPLLCLQAVRNPSPAREQFLRKLPHDWTQSVEVHGFAILALGELLAQKYELVINGGPSAWPEPEDEFQRRLRAQLSPEWKEYLTVADPEKLRLESCELFREVLAHYADMPVTVSAPYFRNVAKLGEKAQQSLHALENLRPGRTGPAITGTDLEDEKGKIAVKNVSPSKVASDAAKLMEKKKSSGTNHESGN